MVKIAIVQSGSVLYDTATTLQKLHHFVEKASQQKADLILFPGFCLTIPFGTTVFRGIRWRLSKRFGFRHQTGNAQRWRSPRISTLLPKRYYLRWKRVRWNCINCSRIQHSLGGWSSRARRTYSILFRFLLRSQWRTNWQTSEIDANCFGAVVGF